MCWFKKKKEIVEEEVVFQERYNTNAAVDFSAFPSVFSVNRVATDDYNHNTEIGYFNVEGKAKSWYMNCDNIAYELLLKQFYEFKFPLVEVQNAEAVE